MNTQNLGTPSIVPTHDDHLIPADPSHLSTIIERLAASHADVLEKWNRNFALNLRRPQVVQIR